MFKKILLGKHNEGTNTKKKTENMIVFVIILVITFIAINNIWNDDSDKNAENVSNGEVQLAALESNGVEIKQTSTEFEIRLENILKTIKNVGNVKVLINYSETSEVIAMYNETTNENTTQETDSNGGTRVSTDVQTSKEVIMDINQKKLI